MKFFKIETLIILSILILFPCISKILIKEKKEYAQSSIYELVDSINKQIIVNNNDNDLSNNIIDKNSYEIAELLDEPYNVKVNSKTIYDGNVIINNHKVTRIIVKINKNYKFIYDGETIFDKS